MAQDYDVSLKYLIDHFTEDYARLIFGNVDAKIELLDREMAATKHYVDALARVTIGTETFIFHPEFVGDYDKDIPERMYKYSARIMDKYPGLAVYGAVFYINENARKTCRSRNGAVKLSRRCICSRGYGNFKVSLKKCSRR